MTTLSLDKAIFSALPEYDSLRWTWPCPTLEHSVSLIQYTGLYTKLWLGENMIWSCRQDLTPVQAWTTMAGILLDHGVFCLPAQTSMELLPLPDMEPSNMSLPLAH